MWKFARRFERHWLGQISFLYSNKAPDKFSIHQVKISFKQLSFARKAYLTCRKRHPPPQVLKF